MLSFSPTKLQRLRLERGLSRKALAQAAGVHYWSIQSWERGQHLPRGLSVAAIARALGVEFDDLFEESEEPATEVAGSSSGDERKIAAHPRQVRR